VPWPRHDVFRVSFDQDIQAACHSTLWSNASRSGRFPFEKLKPVLDSSDCHSVCKTETGSDQRQGYRIGAARKMSVDIDASPDLLLFIQHKLHVVQYRYGSLSGSNLANRF